MGQRPLGYIAHEVPVVSQGTWYIDGAHRPPAAGALRRGLDLVITHIDTAEMCGDAGLLVGEAITGDRS